MKKKLFKNIEGNTFKLKESSLPTYDTTINHPETDEEIDVTVQYEYMPAERGSRERGTGLQLEPDYPSSIEIHSVVDDQGKEHELSKLELERIENEILDMIKDRADDYNDYDR